MDQWGPLEIILVLVLVLGILGAVNGKKQPAFAPTTDGQSLSTLSEKDKRCGLSLSTPKSLERVKDTVRLSGSVSGCKWKIDGTTALYAQIVNGGGAPVSAFTTVSVLTTDTARSFFDTAISLENAPTSGTGYLILIPAVADSDAVTVRIPLRFTQ